MSVAKPPPAVPPLESGPASRGDADWRLAALLAEHADPRDAVVALSQAFREVSATAAQSHRAERRTRERLIRAQARAERQRGDLQAEIDWLRSRVAGIETSTSWRLTAPLRALLTRLPGVAASLRPPLRWLGWALTGRLGLQLRHRRRLAGWRRLLAGDPLFDADWYRQEYPEAGADPVLDYLTVGAAAGRNPGPDFSTRFYWEQNPDVAAAGANPLVHYLEQGRQQGRPTAPAFQPRFSRDRDYDAWIQAHDPVDEAALARLRAAVASLRRHPVISVLMPIHESSAPLLERAIDSVRAQIYPHWELCVAGPVPADPAVAALLRRHADLDSRIKVASLGTGGGASAAEGAALDLARGDYIALLEPDAQLPPHALYWVAAELDHWPDTDALFSDEDKIDSDGFRGDPNFKPDWNPALMLGQDAFAHLGVFRRPLVMAVGGFRPGFSGGAAGYDLILRLASATTPDAIRHIPRILYHACARPPGADGGDQAWHAGKRAVEDHLVRLGRPGTVSRAPGGGYRVDYALVAPPRVSIIIPTRDKLDLLRGCLDSLRTVSTYPDVEIIVVDNGSTDAETLAYLGGLASVGAIRVLRDDGPFNYSRLNNRAAGMATGEYLCLLNNDTVVITPDWLGQMMAHAMLPDVGAVGALLYYADDTIQHAGVTIGMGGVAGHVHRRLPRGEGGYAGRATLTQDVSAVTGACLLTRRALFLELGGLNERDLTVAFNDVDYCLRLRAAGYRVVLAATAELYHLESVSRGPDTDPAKSRRFAGEIDYMVAQWADMMHADPCFNPNLDLESTTPRLAKRPRLLPEA
ncbi:glycosyltransferase family 2 protein [Nitrospirillum iridis]|uniref:GT2 family glycosyltransferase n=1 Tax=Nitrospirillum iridis TaxID=765888 RepID=A0A7X0AWQ2_9PROT|nr:glycosyltransferase family 2 protein [Nitrospirillum iridis]MBB6251509.1 GT2 family glycosyltransferase [Nitrospirillum iridis]